MLSLQANNSIAIKKKLRENLLRKRKALTKSRVVECSEKVFKNFQRKFYESNFYKMGIIAAYLPINNELDTCPILNLLQREKIKIALPKVVKDELKFYEWNQKEPLIYNEFNIREPSGNKEVCPALLIIPLLGFDKHGNRLGYGAGYYDKALSKLPNAKKIGIGYSFQQVKDIPLEAHDIKLDLIITDNQIMMPNSHDTDISVNH